MSLVGTLISVLAIIAVAYLGLKILGSVIKTILLIALLFLVLWFLGLFA